MVQGGSSVRLLAWGQIRSRWRSLVALGLLAGITAGLALAATSGAERSATALDRLREAEDAPDAIVFASQAGYFDADLDALEAAPEVEEVAPWALGFGAYEDPRFSDPGAEDIIFVALDDRYMGGEHEPPLIDGRMFDPSAPDELVVADDAAAAYDIGVGDHVGFRFFSTDQFTEAEPSAPAGPDIDFEVVGIVRTSRQELFVPEGLAVVSPGFADEYADEAIMAPNADVHLVEEPGAALDLRASANELIGPGTPLLDLDQAARRVKTTTDVERTALLALAAVLAAIGMVVVGQAVVRSVRVLAEDAPALQAIGMRRRSMVATVVLIHLPALAVAATTMLATAAITSIWLPLGKAADLDVDRGVVIHGPLTAVFVASLAVVFLGTVLVAGRSAARVATPRSTARSGDRLKWVRQATPLPVALGALMAFPRPGDRTRSTVGPAMVAAIVGIVGVVGVLTIDHGLDDALDHPERAGVAWDAVVQPASVEDYRPRDIGADFVDEVAAQQEVAAVSVVDRETVSVEGTGVPAFAARTRDGALAPEIDLVVTDGRAPQDDHELAVGPSTADQLDIEVGDEVLVAPSTAASEGEGQGQPDQPGAAPAPPRPMTVVGEALFPQDVHSGFDEGVLLTEAGFDAVVPPTDLTSDIGPQRLVAVRYDDGVDPDTATDELADRMGGRAVVVDQAEVPPELTNLEAVRRLPVLLAAFLAVLAVGAVAHALATSARSRRADYAVLRSLGMTRGGTRGVVHSQSTLIALIGLAVGVPVGLVLGRQGWAQVAESVPLAVVLPLALVVTLLVIPIGLLVANVAAWWPGHRLHRLKPAEVLRAEG